LLQPVAPASLRRALSWSLVNALTGDTVATGTSTTGVVLEAEVTSAS
jgi:hypothetical protein